MLNSSIRCITTFQASNTLVSNTNNLTYSLARADFVYIFIIYHVSHLRTLVKILHTVAEAQLDLVQLHGSEAIDLARHIPVPVIKVFHASSDARSVAGITRGGAHHFVLLDSMREDGLSGGSGKVADWELARSLVQAGEIVTDGTRPMLEASGGAPAQVLSVEEGALTPLWAAAAPEAGKLKGAFIMPFKEVAPEDGLLKDEGLAKELWETSEAVIKDVLSKA